MRVDRNGIPRSKSNSGDMEQKDHVLRLARGIAFRDGNLSDFISLLCRYVDSDDDTILDQQPLYGPWMLGGACEPVAT